jgi:hypothetical protein
VFLGWFVLELALFAAHFERVSFGNSALKPVNHLSDLNGVASEKDTQNKT